MSEQPNWSVNLYEEQPDVGGNRHYDYISIEEHDAAERTLETKEKWRDLSSHEIVVLRSKLKHVGINPDLADHEDRLALIRCVLAWKERANYWNEEHQKLSKEFKPHAYFREQECDSSPTESAP